MPRQIRHGEVKFKVRRTALMLGEFTIAQLVQATGLNPESVRTEVQRLRREGFVVSERVPGKREAVYRLSEDAEKRLEFSRSIEAFYPPPAEFVLLRPTSRLYRAAVHSLNQAEAEQGAERARLLELARHELEGAWHAEGASLAPETVQAYLIREQGRLACLEGQRESAAELLGKAREWFAAADLTSEVYVIDRYLEYIEVRRRIDASEVVGPLAEARCVLEAVEESGQLPDPWSRLLAGLLDALAQTAEERLIASIFDSVPKEAASQEAEDRMDAMHRESMEMHRRTREELAKRFEAVSGWLVTVEALQVAQAQERLQDRRAGDQQVHGLRRSPMRPERNTDD